MGCTSIYFYRSKKIVLFLTFQKLIPSFCLLFSLFCNKIILSENKMKNKLMIIFNCLMFALIITGDLLYMLVFPANLWVKGVASFLFFACGLVNLIFTFKKQQKNTKKYSILLTIGLFFAMLGDIFLGVNFVVGTGLFALGHIFFFVSFMFLSKFHFRDIFVWLVLVGISFCIMFIPESLNFGSMFPVVVVYALIISLMLAKSLSNMLFDREAKNSALSLIFVGSLMFFLSDMMLMFCWFGGGERVFDVLCLSLYYPAEFVLALSVYLVSFTKMLDIPKMSLARKIWCRIYQVTFRILLPILPYRQPKLFNNYDEMIEKIKSNGLKKLIIVTDESLVRLGLLGEITQKLDENDIKFAIFDKVLPNPTIELVENARKFYLENSCQGIIAFGGGSVIDCAKVMGARVVKPKQSIKQMKGLLKIHKKLPFLVAIPTTAGTGSETTLAAVITDEKTHHKYPINDFCLIPHYAVLDVYATLGLPKSLTATTGMDALTHAIESYIGKSTTTYTRKMSTSAVKLIFDNLYLCYQNGQDIEARKNMLKASFMAGNAFTRSYIGYVHAIAHSLGGEYNIAHGLANAIILPKMLKIYGKSCYKKLSKLAKMVGVAQIDDTPKIATQKFIYFIEEMNRTMNIPNSIDAIKQEDILDLSQKADSEANPLYPVPKLLSKEELAQVYLDLKN